MINNVSLIGLLTDDRLKIEQNDKITVITGFVACVDNETEKVKYIKITLYNDVAKKFLIEQEKYKQNICFYKGEIAYNEMKKENIVKIERLPTVLQDFK